MSVHVYNKLRAKKIGPLKILERIKDNAYRLELPPGISTSDVFNVRYLSPFIPPDSGSKSRTIPSTPEGPDTVASTQLVPT